MTIQHYTVPTKEYGTINRIYIASMKMYLESKRKVGLTSVLDIKELNDYSSLS